MINTSNHVESILGVRNYRILDLRPLPLEKRCFRLSEAFAAMNPGGAFVLVMNESPSRIFQHCKIELEERFAWETLQEGPEEWRVLITKIGVGNP